MFYPPVPNDMTSLFHRAIASKDKASRGRMQAFCPKKHRDLLYNIFPASPPGTCLPRALPGGEADGRLRVSCPPRSQAGARPGKNGLTSAYRQGREENTPKHAAKHILYPAVCHTVVITVYKTKTYRSPERSLSVCHAREQGAIRPYTKLKKKKRICFS